VWVTAAPGSNSGRAPAEPTNCVHCAALGCPVAGEAVYGNPASRGPLQLHARSIKLPLYPGRAPLETTAPVPPHMMRALEKLGYQETATA